MFNGLFFRLRSLFRSQTVESETEAELRFHREHQIEKYLRTGMTRDEALRQVRLDFGGLPQIREECRDARGVSFFESIVQDLRYGWRTLLKSPAFAAAALFTLALGIGANTAIFSVVYGILLRPLPFRDASRLVLLNETTPRVGMVSVSYPNFLDWRAQSRAFSEMAAVKAVGFNMSGTAQPENIGGLAVSPGFLPMMGIRPVIGRGFAPGEEKAGTAPVVLLSFALWQSHFGGSGEALGQTIRLNRRTFTIVGVLPPGFRWVDRCDILEPAGVWATNNEAAADRGERGDLAVVGRLAPGVRIERARVEMEGIASRLASAYPEDNQFGVNLQPLRDGFSGDMRPAVLVLLGAAVFVLLVACANVANLFLMRGAVRAREMSLRLAIGASRGRIARQVLTESFLVALLGGVAGVGLAMAGIHAIARWTPPETLAGASIDMNRSVLLFSAALVVLSMFVFGLAPALHSTGGDIHSGLKQGGKATTSGARSRLRSLLAATEVALALILMVGAGLMMKSLYRLLAVDPGIRAEHVLKLEMSLRTAQYEKDQAVLNFWRQALDKVRALPGVESVAVGTAIPLTDDHSRTDIRVEGMPVPGPGKAPHPDQHTVSPEYEKVLGVRLLRGRGFTDADRENAPLVAMVNATFAQRLFPGADPVGKRFAFGRLGAAGGHKWITIVGVVADTKMYGLANPARLEVYLPFRQAPSNEMTLLVKSRQELATLVAPVRAVIASIDKEQPVFGIATMQEVVNSSTSMRRVTLILLEVFSGLALLLASIGIYGVVSYSVAQRAREIGVRVALGARRADVLRLVLAHGGRISAAGLIIGGAASLGLTRLLANLLYSVSAIDPATLAAASFVLALVSMLACYIPARRALKVDPLVALRHE
ncbi:MAG: ABC transporter permease [Candidatus Sulfopaludibacter sp.]|nr:ABC transporter permease [Candidatus Sulfopaludibacter sp.]